MTTLCYISRSPSIFIQLSEHYTYTCCENMLVCSVNVSLTGKQEYDVFIQHYSKLISILQVDLTPHFVTAKIITLSDEDEITKASTISHRAAMKMLLKPVSLSLETGYTTSFYKMLEIIQQHGNDAAQHLAGEMLAEVKSPEVKKSDGKNSSSRK